MSRLFNEALWNKVFKKILHRWCNIFRALSESLRFSRLYETVDTGQFIELSIGFG